MVAKVFGRTSIAESVGSYCLDFRPVGSSSLTAISPGWSGLRSHAAAELSLGTDSDSMADT